MTHLSPIVPLATLEDVKSLLPIRQGNTTFDAKLLGLLKLATAQISTATRRQFDKRERVEFHNTRASSERVINLGGVDTSNDDTFLNMGTTLLVRGQIVVLEAFPIDTAAEFEVRYDPAGIFPTDSIVVADNYTVDDDLSRVLLRFGTRRGIRSLRVRYTAGFLAATVEAEEGPTLSASVPNDLQQAAIIQTVYLYKKLDSENVGSRQDKKQGGPNLDFINVSGLTPEALSLVMRYRRLLKGTT